MKHLPATSERLHGLDAVRGFALLLGVALHASMSYLPGAEYFWVVADGERSRVLAVLFFWVHSFRMILFFVLAGFFGRLLLERRGGLGFLRDRGRRILLPLLVFWAPLLVAVAIVAGQAAAQANGGQVPEPPPLSSRNFPLMHLWFLYLLCFCYAGALLLDRLLRVLDRHGRWRQRLSNALLGPAAVGLLAMPGALLLATREGWWHWFGVPTPDSSLYPNLVAVGSYAVAFLAGWGFRGQPARLRELAERWPLHLGLALAATLACLALAGVQPPSTMAPTAAPETWLYAALYALSGWAWTLALIGLALRFLSGHSPARRYLADASYFIYLMHLPVVMALQLAVRPLAAPWWIEYPLLLGLALAILLAGWHWGAHGRALGRWLNGQSAPSPLAASPA